jgi:hypothetical protein
VILNTFFGPWLVQVDKVDVSPEQSFVITGSDGADGRYPVAYGEPFEVSVDGAAWTVEIDELDHDVWTPATAQPPVAEGGARRITKFDPADGLIALLGTGSHAYETLMGDIWYLGMRLRCISKDPETNPNPMPNPYDFTIPHGPSREG